MNPLQTLRPVAEIEFAAASKAALVPEAEAVGARAAELVHAEGVCKIDTGSLGLPHDQTASLAAAIFESFAARLDQLLGVGFETTWKQQHLVVDASDPDRRILLPHHDGGSVTKLETAERPLSEPGRRRKAYAAFIVVEAGLNPDAVTVFYPLLPLVEAVCGRGEPRGGLAWYNETLANLAEFTQDIGIGGRYLTLPTLLGVRSRTSVVVDRSDGHNDLTPEELALAPELLRLRGSCPCGTCPGEVARVFCRDLHDALGLTLSQLHREFGSGLAAAAGDLVLWNNVFLQHGAIGGGKGRTLRHGYLTSPYDARYSRWLDRMWRHCWRDSTDRATSTVKV
ncbi:MAG: hypothetical protein ACRDXX_21525 [Stackebrandtia sp.]